MISSQLITKLVFNNYKLCDLKRFQNFRNYLLFASKLLYPFDKIQMCLLHANFLMSNISHFWISHWISECNTSVLFKKQTEKKSIKQRIIWAKNICLFKLRLSCYVCNYKDFVLFLFFWAWEIRAPFLIILEMCVRMKKKIEEKKKEGIFLFRFSSKEDTYILWYWVHITKRSSLYF